MRKYTCVSKLIEPSTVILLKRRVSAALGRATKFATVHPLPLLISLSRNPNALIRHLPPCAGGGACPKSENAVTDWPVRHGDDERRASPTRLYYYYSYSIRSTAGRRRRRVLNARPSVLYGRRSWSDGRRACTIDFTTYVTRRSRVFARTFRFIIRSASNSKKTLYTYVTVDANVRRVKTKSCARRNGRLGPSLRQKSSLRFSGVPPTPVISTNRIRKYHFTY